jgi:hypothetical protein
VDPILLTAGLVRVGLWAFAAYLAWRTRRWVPVAGFSLATACAAILGVTNAGGQVPWPLQEVATLVATPAVALITAAYYLRAPRDYSRWRP